MRSTYKAGVVLFWALAFLDAYFLPESLEDYYQNNGLSDLNVVMFLLQVIVWVIGTWMSIKGIRRRIVRKQWDRLVYYGYLVLLLPFITASLIAAVILDIIGVGSFSPPI